MAIIAGGAAQKAARTMLQNIIRDAARRGSLSSTDEMIGYFLSGLRTAEAYNPTNESEIKRRIIAPEFLTGLLKDDTA